MDNLKVSKGKGWLQVTADFFYPQYLPTIGVKDQIGPDDPAWPRMKIVAKEILNEVQDLELLSETEANGLKLVSVDQRVFAGGLLQRQYSFKKG